MRRDANHAQKSPSEVEKMGTDRKATANKTMAYKISMIVKRDVVLWIPLAVKIDVDS